MTVLIATPCAHDAVHSAYASTIFHVARTLTRRGIEADIQLVGASDLELSRSFLASYALAIPTVSHLLFIDSDMSFTSRLVSRMLDFDRDFVGIIAPRRTLPLEPILADARADPTKSAGQLVPANLEYVGAVQLGLDIARRRVGPQVIDGFAKAEFVGMGVTLLKRRVLEEMVARDLASPRPGGRHPACPWPVPYYGFFHKERDGDGQFLSEDISFGRRWSIGCGGEIWACIDEAIGHHGSYGFIGAYQNRLDAGKY